MSHICANCGGTSAKWHKSCKLDHSTHTIGEGLNMMFGVRSSPVSTSIESNGICHKCFLSLCQYVNCVKTVEKKKAEFMRQTSQSSMVASNYTSNQGIGRSDAACQTTLATPNITNTRKITPIRMKIRKAVSHPSSRTSYQRTISAVAKAEMQNLIKTHVFHKEPLADEDDFRQMCNTLYSKLRSDAPTIYAFLNTILGFNSKKFLFAPQMATIVSIGSMVYNKNCNRFQKTIGIELWKAKAPQKTYKIFQKLGLCASYMTVVRHLDDLSIGYDKPVLDWQQGVHKLLNKTSEGTIAIAGSANQPLDVLSDQDTFYESTLKRRADYTPSKSHLPPTVSKTSRRCLLDAFEAADKQTQAEPMPLAIKHFSDAYGNSVNADSSSLIGMSITFDNLNKQMKAGEYYSGTKTKVLNVVNTIAYFNRVPLDEKSFLDTSVKRADQIPINSFLLSEDDQKIVHDDHIFVVKSILVENVNLFDNSICKTKLEERRDSNYAYSSKKTVTVNLGIWNHDENSTHGVLEIMNKIQEYSPKDLQGKHFPLAVRGDGLTTDRQRAAQMVRLNAITEDGKFSSNYPIVSDWHKRVILLQDDINKLFKGNEHTGGRGTLPHFRALLGHKQAGLELKKKFNYTYDLYKFTLYTYVAALAVKLLTRFDSDGSTYIPSINDMTTDDLLTLFDATARNIVDFCWHDVSKAGLQIKYCICNKDFDADESDDYIGCESNECKITWFHKDCIKKSIINSQHQKIEPAYLPIPKNSKAKWWCSKLCRDKSSDKVYEYSKDFMFSALMHESFKNALRNNYGEKFHIYNKIHLIQFYRAKHHVYFRLAHRMHLYYSGCAPASVRHEMLWNSTVNMVGKPGYNIEVDLFNEFTIKFMKENVLNINNQTEASIERRSRAFRLINNTRIDLENYLMGEEEEHYTKKRKEKWRADLQEGSKCLIQNQVFDVVPGRSHEGFEQHDLSHFYIDDINKYKKALQSFSIQFDLAKSCWDAEFENEN